MKAVKKEWQLQEVKNRFSEVVNLALADGPQTITRRGKPVAVMISVEEFRRLAPQEKVDFDLLEHLLACPDGDLLCEALEHNREDMRRPVREHKL